MYRELVFSVDVQRLLMVCVGVHGGGKDVIDVLVT